MKYLLILASLMMLAASSPQYVGHDDDSWRGVGEPGVYIPHLLRRDEDLPGVKIPHVLRWDKDLPGVNIPHVLRWDKDLPGVNIPHVLRWDKGLPGVYIPHMLRQDDGQPGVYIPHSPVRVISMDHWDWLRPRLTADSMPGVNLLDPRAAMINADMMDMDARKGGLFKNLGKFVAKHTIQGLVSGIGEGAVNVIANRLTNSTG